MASTRSAPRYRACRSAQRRSEEHTSELQSRGHLVCRLLPHVAPPYALSLHDALPIFARLVYAAESQGVNIDAATRDALSTRVSEHVLPPNDYVAFDHQLDAWRLLDLPLDTEPAAVLSADRKSTRLNSSHVAISYAVFCRTSLRHTLFPYTTLFRSSHVWFTPQNPKA